MQKKTPNWEYGSVGNLPEQSFLSSNNRDEKIFKLRTRWNSGFDKLNRDFNFPKLMKSQ